MLINLLLSLLLILVALSTVAQDQSHHTLTGLEAQKLYSSLFHLKEVQAHKKNRGSTLKAGHVSCTKEVFFGKPMYTCHLEDLNSESDL